MTKQEREMYSACKWALRNHKEGRRTLSEEKLKIITKYIRELDCQTHIGYDNRVHRKGKGSVILCSGNMSPDPIVRKGFKR